jgi:hypothetical protein
MTARQHRIRRPRMGRRRSLGNGVNKEMRDNRVDGLALSY